MHSGEMEMIMGTNFVVQFFGQEFSIDRVAFSIGSFAVYWYGILIAVGFLGALIYAYRRAPDFKISLDPMVDVVLVGAIGAVVCARLYYVAMQWSQFADDPLKILDLRTGGLAIYGGVIGAFLFGGLMCRVKKIKVFAMFDLAGIGFLLGQAVGRWGNFVNQEAFGVNTTMPWGMFSEGTYAELLASKSQLAAIGVTVDPSLPVHPCFLYESIWCLAGFVLLHFYSKHRRFDGEIALAYIAYYGLGRFFIEGLRTDSLMIGPIRASQLLALLCFVGGGIALFALRRKFRPMTEAERAYEPLFAIDQPLMGEEEPLLSVSLHPTERVLPVEPDRPAQDNKPSKEETDHGREN